MPELPEVETTRRGLLPHLQGQTLREVVIHNARLRWPVPADLPRVLSGRRLAGIERRGKYLLFDFDGVVQLVHLGMSGSLRLLETNEPLTAHEHVEWRFGRSLRLRLRDPRRFGAVLLAPDPPRHPLLAHLGPEPLSQAFDGDTLYRASRGRRTAIKNLIMDSHIVVGVGNIYASEALFHAGIRPARAAGRLSRASCGRLAEAIRRVLQAAIQAGGSSLRDYVAADGELGYFQTETRVYGREGQPCRACGTPIRRQLIGQRSTFFCPACQK